MARPSVSPMSLRLASVRSFRWTALAAVAGLSALAAAPAGAPPPGAVPPATPSVPLVGPPCPLRTGTVTGRVTHADGTPADFVTVILDNRNAAVSLTRDTDDDGRFTFTGVPAGDYKAYAFETGLTSDVLEIHVAPDATARADIQLRKEKASKTIRIACCSRPACVDVKLAERPSSTGAAFVKPVPVKNTRIQEIAPLMPGVARAGASDARDVSACCGAASKVGYRLNGVSVDDPNGGGAPQAVPGGAIASFKLVTNGFDARYRDTSSALVRYDAAVPRPGRAEGRHGEVAETRQGTSAGGQADTTQSPLPPTHGAPPESSFRSVGNEPLATFSADVDTASYSNVRRMLGVGFRPPPEAVRIEEMINYFHYDLPKPSGGAPISVTADMASCPWRTDHRLLRVALRARDLPAGGAPPCNLVFLVDTSGSMNPPLRLPLVVKGLKALSDVLDRQDRIAIVTYESSASVALPATSGADHARIRAALDALHAAGGTNGADGLRKAYDVAVANLIPGGANRVILATDGDFNVGDSSDSAVVRLIESERTRGVFLTILGVGDDNFQDEKLEALADKGNGVYAYLDSVEEARKVLVEMAGPTLVTVAKDVKVQVELNPTQVAAWRLLGYDDRRLAKEDFDDDTRDAGDMGAGHETTALFEIAPIGTPSVAPQGAKLRYQRAAELTEAAGSGETCTVKVRYQQPDGRRGKLIQVPVTDAGADLAAASADFRFATAVALSGETLRGSSDVTAPWTDIRALATAGLGRDSDGSRHAFLDLLSSAEHLVPLPPAP